MIFIALFFYKLVKYHLPHRSLHRLSGGIQIIISIQKEKDNLAVVFFLFIICAIICTYALPARN